MTLSTTQEIVEVRLDNDIRGSLKDQIDTALATNPLHRVVALSTVTNGEYPL